MIKDVARRSVHSNTEDNDNDNNTRRAIHDCICSLEFMPNEPINSFHNSKDVCVNLGGLKMGINYSELCSYSGFLNLVLIS